RHLPRSTLFPYTTLFRSTGEELPPGRGTPKEGAKVFTLQGCIVCHGEEGVGGLGPALKSKTSQDLPIWRRERILPLRSPFATTRSEEHTSELQSPYDLVC